MKAVIVILIGIILLAALAGNIMSNVEQPEYKVITSKQNIEIRDYSPMILAEVETSGERKEAIKDGFKILADYIFGNNISNKNVKMAAPVANEPSEKMAMTAPVTQEKHFDKWKVRFVMPKKYNLETIPKPISKEIHLTAVPAKRFAVIRFSGLPDDQNIKQHANELKAYIFSEKLKPIGEAIFAFYNPPWTLPFLRRNEIMIEIEEPKS